MASRTAIVTGAASGIGRAIAQRLIDDDFDVLAVDLEPAEDGPGVAHAADLTTREGNRGAIDAAIEHFGRLDAIVPERRLPARRADRRVPRGPLGRADRRPAHLARSCSPATAGSTCAKSGDGRFIAIASAHALAASPYKAGYVAAKHGVLGLVRTLALEGAEHGILASAVCPGFVRTPLVEKQIPAQAKAHGVSEEEALEQVILAPHAVKRLIEPEEVAERRRVPARPRRARVHGRAGLDGPRLDRALSRGRLAWGA